MERALPMSIEILIILRPELRRNPRVRELAVLGLAERLRLERVEEKDGVVRARISAVGFETLPPLPEAIALEEVRERPGRDGGARAGE